MTNGQLLFLVPHVDDEGLHHMEHGGHLHRYCIPDYGLFGGDFKLTVWQMCLFKFLKGQCVGIVFSSEAV